MSVDLLELVIAAHGGLDVWEGAEQVSVDLSSGGFAFASKLQGRALRDLRATISTRGQHVVLSPYPEPGQRGILEQDGTVRIESDDGAVIETREHARDAFRGLRHQLWWDRLDILYFATYALWNYVSTPFVFARDEYEVTELNPWSENGEQYRRLAVTFPPAVHTHSCDQVFYIDANGLIRRHDYTAEPIGGWANAAHYCSEHRSFEGLIVPTRRRVYPRKSNNEPRGGPLLVWIDVSHAAIGRQRPSNEP